MNDSSNERGRRFGIGFGWGVAATVAMTIVMLIAMAAGVAPMPRPIPAAIWGNITGGGLPRPVLMAVAMLSHLAYGGVWGGVLALLSRRVTVPQGLALGFALWLIMQLIVLPFIGWGLFGTAITPRIAVGTLVLHLVYGGTFGALMDRGVATENARQPAESSRPL